MQVEGIVKNIVTRPWGNKIMYSIGLVNEQGLFGFGPNNPHVNPGDKVYFTSEKNDKGYESAKVASLKIEKATPDTVQTAVKATGAANAQTGYWDRKEARDLHNDSQRELGATRNTAIEWIKLLVSQEALKLPAGPKRESFLNTLLADYMNLFMGKTTLGPTEAPTKAKAVKVTEPENAVNADEEWE
jgi:plastocyanin